MSANILNVNPLGWFMQGMVECVCGRKIDLAGETPRLDGTKVFCVVCGATTTHYLGK